MIQLRSGKERGQADHGWLQSWHSFSFADYYAPAQMGWGALRVINEDYVAPGKGFGTHGHRDMEIVTVMLGGALQHKDSMGNGAVIEPGEVQYMSAGRGVMHSEFNPSPSTTSHLLQIWIQPAAPGGAPAYGQKRFDPAGRQGALQLLVSGDGRLGSIAIRQDADLFQAVLAPGNPVTHTFAPGRLGYLHVVRGALKAGGHALAGGDALKLEGEATLTLTAEGDAEVLLFDLPSP